MKKIIIIISLLFSLLLSTQFYFLSLKKSKELNDFYLVDKSQIMLEKVDTGCFGFRVGENEYAAEIKRYESRINSIKTYNIEVMNPSSFYEYQYLYINDEVILNDGSTFTVDKNSRVKGIYGNTLVLEDLDNITLSLTYRTNEVSMPFEKMDFYIDTCGTQKLELVSYSLDMEELAYEVVLKINNNNNLLFSNQLVEVHTEASIFIADKFIHYEFLHGDNGKYYVYKGFNYKDGYYYKVVEVDVLYTVGDYVAISSSEIDKDNIVLKFIEEIEVVYGSV